MVLEYLLALESNYCFRIPCETLPRVGEEILISYSELRGRKSKLPERDDMIPYTVERVKHFVRLEPEVLKMGNAGGNFRGENWNLPMVFAKRKID